MTKGFGEMDKRRCKRKAKSSTDSDDVALDLSSQSSSSSTHSSLSSLSSTLSSSSGSKKARASGLRSQDGGDYRLKRERNNEAVKKSRAKSRCKLSETLESIDQLSASNEKLLREIDILTKEADIIRCIYVSHMKDAHNRIVADDELIADAN
ncbi:CCAAT/enhancer-binding protein gamma [Halotydeus destructor]|nr:CCAAT/enhancer-binding protein gamma [Halotydeus destructor]